MITSKDNKYVKLARSLQLKKNRINEKMFVVEGKNLVEEAVNMSYAKHVFTTEESSKFNQVSDEVMQSMSAFKTHVKYLAICSNLEISNDKSDLVLVLDNIQDPGNLGTLIRSAVAFNFDKIVCSKTTTDMYNPKALSASQGAIFHICVEYCDLESYLLNSSNVAIASSLSGEDAIIDDQKIDLIVGNEGNGVSDKILDLCDKFVKIEMSKNIESLNAGVAGSILMYKIGVMK